MVDDGEEVETVNNNMSLEKFRDKGKKNRVTKDRINFL